MDWNLGVVALNRFGIGAGRIDRNAASQQPIDSALAELDTIDELQPTNAPNATSEGLAAFVRRRSVLAARARQASGTATETDESMAALPFRRPGEMIEAELGALMSRSLSRPNLFKERLSLYWADHFSMAGLSHAFLLRGVDADAIRPNLTRRFRDILVATVLHPAMLLYLDNRSSVGPASMAAFRSRGRRGLNENLGREILELHTLGSDGGYDQDDVIAMAKALSGWSVDLTEGVPDNDRTGFFPDLHEPGPKTVLGRVYAQDGAGQAVAILNHLAVHPSTARNVSRRFVRHFVGEGFPGLEARMASVFLRTEGDLRALIKALLRDPEAWGAPCKVRPPIEFLIAVVRLLNWMPDTVMASRALRAMGQPFRSPPSPKGWPSENDAWAAPDSIKTRLDWAAEVAAHVGADVDARGLLDTAFGPAASAETRQAVARASSGRQALILLLMSPEFQRR